MSVIVKSGVAGKVPTTAQLEYGQLALNYADQKLYFKNSSNLVKSYDEVPKSVGYGDATYARIAQPGGGAYTTTTTTVTGAIEIKLPSIFNSHMLGFTVRIFEYVTGRSLTINIFGYTYAATSVWYNVTAFCNEEARYRNINVRFGKDATETSRPTIYIGELGSTWTFPQVSITDVLLGYSAVNRSDFLSGWNIGFETTSFGAIDYTINLNTTRQSLNTGRLSNIESIATLSPVVSNTTNWYRLCSLSTSNASCYAKMHIYLPGHHTQYMVTLSNGAGGDNCLLSVELMGNYLYYDRMPSDWRLVLGGTNGVTHLDIRYPFMSTNQASLQLNLVEQNTNAAGQITFPMTNQGTTEALAWYGIRMSSGSAVTYGKVKIRNGNYYREAYPGFTVSTGTITNQTVVV